MVEWLGPCSVRRSVLGLNLGGDIFFFFFSFKTQLYIPSRKAVYVVEHVEKRTKHVKKKRENHAELPFLL